MALALNGNTVYAAGQFTSIGGQTRSRIAALDTTTGLATSWDPNAIGEIYCLSLKDNLIYAGGSFNSIGGQTRNQVAALDITTGLASSWNPNANSYVNTLYVNESTVFVGGDFSIIGGTARRNFAVMTSGALPLYYRTRQSGNWNDINTWEASPVVDFSSQVSSPATSAPKANAASVKILNGHTVNVTANETTVNVSVNPAGRVIVNPGINFIIK